MSFTQPYPAYEQTSRLTNVWGTDPLPVGAASAKQGCTSSDAWDKTGFHYGEHVLALKPYYAAVGDTA